MQFFMEIKHIKSEIIDWEWTNVCWTNRKGQEDIIVFMDWNGSASLFDEIFLTGYNGNCRFHNFSYSQWHYRDVIMSTTASQITGVLIVCSMVCSGADQRKHQSSASLALWGESIHDPYSTDKGPVTQTRAVSDCLIRPLPASVNALLVNWA